MLDGFFFWGGGWGLEHCYALLNGGQHVAMNSFHLSLSFHIDTSISNSQNDCQPNKRCKLNKCQSDDL